MSALGDERLAIVLANLVNGADVRMIERGCRLGLAFEAFQGLRVVRQFWWKELQRDETVEACVLRLVDHAHPSAADLLNNAVMRDGLANHGTEAAFAMESRTQSQASQRSESGMSNL